MTYVSSGIPYNLRCESVTYNDTYLLHTYVQNNSQFLSTLAHLLMIEFQHCHHLLKQYSSQYPFVVALNLYTDHC